MFSKAFFSLVTRELGNSLRCENICAVVLAIIRPGMSQMSCLRGSVI